MRATLATLITAVFVVIPSTSSAQTADAVVVLYNGGVSTVEVFDLSASAPRVARRLGNRPIVPASLGPIRVSDIKVLPDGSHLLANVDGRGAVVTSPDGQEIVWELDPQRRLIATDCASVGSYFAPGEPSLVVSGDSASSNVTVRSTSQNATVWFDTVRLATSRGLVPQVAVMPGNRIAMALNWADIGVHGIRIRNTSDPLDDPRDFLSATYIEAPDTAVIVDELDDVIRDLMVLEDGRLLVTLRYAMVILEADGGVASVIDIGMLPEVSGELASVRVLPSGLWAIASFEPGQWIEPNVNHRVHWLDPVTLAIVASSEPLQRAPLRVEAQSGMGGTNTVGFDGGLDLIQQGDPSTIDVVNLVVPAASRIGTFLNVRGVVENTGTLPVGLSRLSVRAAPGTCSPNVQPVADLAFATSVAVLPGQQFAWVGETWLDATYALGEWCAFVEGVDQQGVQRRYGEPVEFELIESTEATGTVIDVRPITFGTGPEDMGGDGGDGGDVGPEVEPDKGCCATTASPRTPIGALLLWVSAILWARGRGRR